MHCQIQGILSPSTRKQVIGLSFDPIAAATARKAKLDETVPANGSITVIEQNVRNPFKGTVLDEDGVEHKVNCALQTDRIILTEAGLHTQKVGGAEKAASNPDAKDQFVLTLTGYFENGKLLVAGEDGDVEYPLPERVEGQMFSFSAQKFACSEEAAMMFGKLLEGTCGWTEPETIRKDNPESKIQRIWTKAVPVPNETTMRRANVIAQRIDRALKAGPYIARLEVGENWTPDKGGFKNFLYNFTQSLALAEDMADDEEDKERRAAAGTLISSLTGRKENAPRVDDDGKRTIPVYPERADVGRLTIEGFEPFDFWTSGK